MVTEKQVREVLSHINDPELHRSLTELNMVRSVKIDGEHVEIEIALTTPECPMKKTITNLVAEGVSRLEGVKDVNVKLGAMTEEQRREMAARIYGKTAGEKGPEDKKAPAGDFAKRVIAVASGKGGVGKSTVTANLAAALSKLGQTVGVLDADVYGFSIPRILGVSGEPTALDQNLIPLRRDDIQVMSIGFFVDENTPVIWRGPLLHKTVNQFIADVLWDQLDFLLIDLPPGTGDVTISIAQALPKAEIMVVTTPQPVASHTAGRVGKLAEQTKLRVLGVVENMSYFESNGKKEYIFGQGGGRDLAERLSVPFLGEIPLKTEIREAADSGQPIVLSDNGPLAGYYLEIAKSIIG